MYRSILALSISTVLFGCGGGGGAMMATLHQSLSKVSGSELSRLAQAICHATC